MKQLQTDGRAADVRRIYAKPVLVSYGNLTHITQTVGTIGNMDGGGPKENNKTSV